MIKNNVEYLNFCIVQKHTINLWKINKMNMEIKLKKKKIYISCLSLKNRILFLKAIENCCIKIIFENIVK